MVAICSNDMTYSMVLIPTFQTNFRTLSLLSIADWIWLCFHLMLDIWWRKKEPLNEMSIRFIAIFKYLTAWNWSIKILCIQWHKSDIIQFHSDQFTHLNGICSCVMNLRLQSPFKKFQLKWNIHFIVLIKCDQSKFLLKRSFASISFQFIETLNVGLKNNLLRHLKFYGI